METIKYFKELETKGLYIKLNEKNEYDETKIYEKLHNGYYKLVADIKEDLCFVGLEAKVNI
jgi:hypothetical protein